MSSPAPESQELLTRRAAVARVAALFGGAALVGQAAMLSGCATGATMAKEFTDADVALLDEIAETILPETDTPGAKAAEVGPFMALMVRDTYYPPEQRVFQEGLRTLESECEALHGVGFLAASPEQRLALLEKLDREQFDEMKGRSRGDETPAHYFRMMKELALLGYFTSEIGYTQAMRYIESPGEYDPCVPYEPGDKIWAAHA